MLMASKLVYFTGLQTCVSYLVWSKHSLLDGNHVATSFRMLQRHAWHCEGSISLLNCYLWTDLHQPIAIDGFIDEAVAHQILAIVICASVASEVLLWFVRLICVPWTLGAGICIWNLQRKASSPKFFCCMFLNLKMQILANPPPYFMRKIKLSTFTFYSFCTFFELERK